MKTISLKSFFKKVSATAAVRAGQKRADLNWSFEGFSAESPEEFPSAEKIAFVLNSFTEAFGRKLIAQNGDDWDFCPTAEQVTFELAFADATSSVSRARLITKESLEKLAQFYILNASKLQVPQASAIAGAQVIRSRFQLIAGKNDALEVMSSRLLSLVEVCEPEEIEPFAALIEALVSEASELQALEISADAL